jgi:hypothetical protein
MHRTLQTWKYITEEVGIVVTSFMCGLLKDVRTYTKVA